MTLSLGRQVCIKHKVGPVVQSEIEHVFLDVIKEVKLLCIKGKAPNTVYIGNLE